ncbi:MAG: glycosyltransferase family 4 protein [Bacteroidales bacterium]|nr:glycosyltransferase family 4 protein [Bacteroidales bacterium]
MKILVNTPILTAPAGVANHYLGLRPYFSKEVVYNQYVPMNYIQTKVPILHTPLRMLTFFFDLIKFIILIVTYRLPTVLLNPSFGPRAMKRDALFMKIAKMLKCKVAVFIHGWNNDYLQIQLKAKDRFMSVWKNADAFFVLAREFEQYLRQLGVTAPIYITTTKVDDRMLAGMEAASQKKGKIINVLFLARVERVKGIFTAIDTFKLLKDKHPFLKMRVVGSGNTLEEAKQYVSEEGIRDVTFTGAHYGENLRNEYAEADLYILPTTHGEGMPTTVLEAMAFGLPVITRPVGGLKDFFENDKMGYMLESLEPNDYAECIERLINNTDKVKEISEYNKQYAKEHFMASKIAQYLEQILVNI